MCRGTRPPRRRLDLFSMAAPRSVESLCNKIHSEPLPSCCFENIADYTFRRVKRYAHYRFLAPILRRILSCSPRAALNYHSPSNSMCVSRCLSSQENTLLHPPQLSVHEVSVACSFTPESRNWKHQVTTTVTINESQGKYFGA